MTGNMKSFIKENEELLNSNMYEFFMSADNELSIIEQGMLVEMLKEAGIDYSSARDSVMNFILTMICSNLSRPIFLDTLIAHELEGRLGFDVTELREYLLENASEYDIDIMLDEKTQDYKIYPRI